MFMRDAQYFTPYETRKISVQKQNFKSFRDGSRAAATSKMERFVIIVNGWKPLTIITKRSILDIAAALDPSLSLNQRMIVSCNHFNCTSFKGHKILKICKYL